MRMSVARLLLCYVLLEDYSTNLSAAITRSSESGRSTASNDDRRTGNVATSTSEAVQRDLTLEDNNVPSFAKTIGNVTAASRGEAVLSCTITGLGNYKVAWLRAADQTILSLGQHMVTHSPRFSVSVDNIRSKNQSFLATSGSNNNNEHQDTMTDELTWRLHIRTLKESDRGCYMCQLNTKPMLSQLGCVDVLVGPDILMAGTSEGEVSVMEGENATLTCNASGRPQPQVHWRSEKNTSILMRGIRDQLVYVNNTTGGRLDFIRADRKQTGAYLCIAKNEVPPAVSKRVYLRVNFPPSAKVDNSFLSSPLNTSVSLICKIEASPKTINVWTRPRNQVIMSNDRYVIDERTDPDDEWKTTMKLQIKNLQRSDLGEYNCSAASSMGTAESSLSLHERIQATTIPPRITLPSPKKSNRDRHRSSFSTTPKHNYNRASTPTLHRTTAPLTSRKKYFFSATSTSTMTPRVSLNGDNNAFKRNGDLNVRSLGMRIIDRRIQVILPTIYSILMFSLSF